MIDWYLIIGAIIALCMWIHSGFDTNDGLIANLFTFVFVTLLWPVALYMIIPKDRQ